MQIAALNISETWKDCSSVFTVGSTHTIQNKQTGYVYFYEGNTPNEADAFIITPYSFMGVSAKGKIWMKSNVSNTLIAINKG